MRNKDEKVGRRERASKNVALGPIEGFNPALKITKQQQWHRRRADKLSVAAARQSTKVRGGAHKLSAARPAHGSTLKSCQI